MFNFLNIFRRQSTSDQCVETTRDEVAPVQTIREIITKFEELAKAEKGLPQKGEKWQFVRSADKNDPWGEKKPPTYVTILDVKEGWVRYSMGKIFNDERNTLEDFLQMYSKV